MRRLFFVGRRLRSCSNPPLDMLCSVSDTPRAIQHPTAVPIRRACPASGRVCRCAVSCMVCACTWYGLRCAVPPGTLDGAVVDRRGIQGEPGVG